MSRRRSWLPFLAVVVLVAVGVVVVVVKDRVSAPRCASTAKVASPLVAPTRFGDDDRLTTLATVVGRLGPPFGPVRAGVGFDYGQWLHLYGVPGGVLAFTKDNAPLTLLDGETLKPRWSLRPETKRIAWDSSADRFALLDLSSKSRVRVGSYDLATGRERWCVRLSAHHRAGDPVSTAFLDDGDLLVALPTEDGGLGVARLAAKDGHVLWSHPLERAGRADFLAQVDPVQLVVGGEEAYRLVDPGKPTPHEGFEVVALIDGERVPFSPAASRVPQHLVGLRGDLVLVLGRNGDRTELSAEGLDGHVQWTTVLPGATVDLTLRGDVVLARSRAGLTGYSADNGAVLWRRPVPKDRTYFPYGFPLDQMPSLDASHVLVPTTTSLQILDVRSGKHRDYPLPTDGIRTTYWPYQLVSTDHLIGVVTNTGAVLTDRDVGPLG